VFLSNSINAVYAGTLEAFRGAFVDTAFVRASLAAIRDAIRDRDAVSAERAMREYLQESGARMVAAVKEQRHANA
jgi:DNA-binding FadR family transcriptional regulator